MSVVRTPSVVERHSFVYMLALLASECVIDDVKIVGSREAYWSLPVRFVRRVSALVYGEARRPGVPPVIPNNCFIGGGNEGAPLHLEGMFLVPEAIGLARFNALVDREFRKEPYSTANLYVSSELGIAAPTFMRAGKARFDARRMAMIEYQRRFEQRS